MDRIISLINTVIQSKALKIPKWILWLIIIVGVIGTPVISGIVSKNSLIKILQDRDIETIQSLKYRAEVSSKIDSVLRILGYRTNADRAFLGEYSNSITGASGMHFLYYTINNEYTKIGVNPIGSDHQKQNFSNYKFNAYLANHKIYGLRDVDSIKHTDPITYLILSKNKTRSAFLMYFEIDEVPIGFVGISFTDAEHIKSSDDMIYYEISKAMRKLSSIFDFKSYILNTANRSNSSK